MEIDGRKGFVYTLEAVMASALVLGVVLTVMPEFQDDSSTSPQSQVLSGLETLDKTGNLTDNLSAAEIESDIAPYVPDAYNYSVDIVEVSRVERNISSPYSEYLSGSGDYSELQLWIDSASNMNVTFDGEKLLEENSDTGYKQLSVSGTEGWLNFTGSSELEFSFDTYNSSTNDIDADQVSVASYLVVENGAKEVRVKLWR